MSLNLLIFFSPIIFLIILSESTIDDNLMYAEISLDSYEIINNFNKWFFAHYKNIGLINLVVFLFGTLFFFIKKKK